MRLKHSVLGRVQIIACQQKLNTMSCGVPRYENACTGTAVTNPGSCTNCLMISVKKLSKCDIRGVSSQAMNQRPWLCSLRLRLAALLVLAQFCIFCNFCNWYLCYEKTNDSYQQEHPSIGTACDIIYQDKIEANINMVYGSSTVSSFYSVISL